MGQKALCQAIDLPVGKRIILEVPEVFDGRFNSYIPGHVLLDDVSHIPDDKRSTRCQRSGSARLIGFLLLLVSVSLHYY